MMIRINLLPVRQAAKKEAGRQFLVVTVGVLLLTLGGNFLWWRARDAELQKKTDAVNAAAQRIAELDRVIGEVNNLEKKRKEVQQKLDELEKLKKKKGGPVRMMDALATCIPPKAQVLEFVEDKGGVKLTGLAESHEDVSDFLRGLNAIVWTPKGLGRVVERKREAPQARVELLTSEGAMEDFAVNDLGYFFSGIELKSSEQTNAPATANNKTDRKIVKFEVAMSANYAI